MPQPPTYRVIKTGEIGELIPSPSDNPVILEFGEGFRDAFFLRELEPTSHQITKSYPKQGKRHRNRGKPKGMLISTLDKMLAIRRYLETQSEPVYRKDIEKVVMFDCTRPLMSQPSEPERVTLESLGIVERSPGIRTWITWRLTELGRTDGEAIIKRLEN